MASIPIHPDARSSDPNALPVLLDALDALPLADVLRAFKAWPLTRCPSAACRSSSVFVIGAAWCCLACGALGGTAAFLAATLGVRR